MGVKKLVFGALPNPNLEWRSGVNPQKSSLQSKWQWVKIWFECRYCGFCKILWF